MTRVLAALLLAALESLASARADMACPSAMQGFQRLKTAEAEIAYRWEPMPLKVGQFFTAEVIACGAPGSGPVEEIAIDATMPAHGHGMNYRPTAVRAGTGHFRFTGLMLHMPGTWRVTFDLLQRGKRTRLTHEVSLKR